QAMTEPVASIPHRCEPCPCWKTSTTTPNAAASESRFNKIALSASTIERNARISRISVSIRTRREDVGQAAEEGMHEVAVDSRYSAERAVRRSQLRVDPVDDRLDAGRGPVDCREGLDERV